MTIGAGSGAAGSTADAVETERGSEFERSRRRARDGLQVEKVGRRRMREGAFAVGFRTPRARRRGQPRVGSAGSGDSRRAVTTASSATSTTASASSSVAALQRRRQRDGGDGRDGRRTGRTARGAADPAAAAAAGQLGEVIGRERRETAESIAERRS